MVCNFCRFLVSYALVVFFFFFLNLWISRFSIFFCIRYGTSWSRSHHTLVSLLFLPGFHSGFVHARDSCSDLYILKIIRKGMEERISYFFLPSWCFHYAAGLLFSIAWHYPYLWILILSICAYSGSCFNCSTKALNQLKCSEVSCWLHFFSIFQIWKQNGNWWCSALWMKEWIDVFCSSRKSEKLSGKG